MGYVRVRGGSVGCVSEGRENGGSRGKGTETEQCEEKFLFPSLRASCVGADMKHFLNDKEREKKLIHIKL